MASLFQRWGAKLFGAPQRSMPRSSVRRFEGAVVDRLTSSWVASGAAIDDELRRDLDKLRARSRDLVKNNEYGKKFVRMVRNNVVGPEGFTLQCRAVDASGKLDTAANNAVELAFWEWNKPAECDVTGKRSFVDMTRAMVVALARDGEFLLREVRGNGAGSYGYQLQIIDINRLDTNLNRSATQGSNAIRMGVEINGVGKPVAYHVWTSPPGIGSNQKRERERWLADDVIHAFIPLEEEDTRGTPWMHATMRRINDLGGYREAAIIAARVGASKMGVWETPDGGPPPGAEAGGGDSPTDLSNGSWITDAAPGHFDFAPPGYKLNTFNPAYPHDQFDAFSKATLRGIASGLGVAYNNLANDLEGVNYSSIRAGVLDERDEWMVIQNFLKSGAMARIYTGFLEMALLRAAIRLPNGTPLPADKRWKFAQHLWLARRWGWVDPLKDIEAAVTAIANNLASPQQIAAQTGRDLEEILDDIVVYRKMLKDRGIDLPEKKAPDKKPEPPPDE